VRLTVKRYVCKIVEFWRCFILGMKASGEVEMKWKYSGMKALFENSSIFERVG
jgi:hypothetical protein